MSTAMNNCCLLLIDSRVPDIETIIGSLNNDTVCAVFNYYHDTPETILSKIRFLNRRNCVIRENFFYEEPPIPVITDPSNCLACDASGNPKQYIAASDIAMQAMEYALASGNYVASDTTIHQPVPTLWPISPDHSSGPVPVFFQRMGQLPVLVTELDEIYKTFITIPYESSPDSTVVADTVFSTVGIIQHSYGAETYMFLKSFGSAALLTDVAIEDPALQTWQPFISTLTGMITRHKINTLDLMACALYADPNWKYVIDELQTRMAVNIRASTDNTGASAMGGNWILETDSANLKDVYFTDAIHGWNHLLATITDTRFYTMSFNDSMYLKYLGSSSAVNVGLGDFTFETWYYETSKQTGCTIFDKGIYNYTWQIRNPNSGGNDGLAFTNTNWSGGEGWLYANAAVVPVAQWSHLAVTRSGSTFKFYINGTLMQTMTGSNATLANNGSNFSIGMQSPDSCLCNKLKTGCRLYDTRMWSTCRTDAQIQQNRNRIVPATTTGLVANYFLTFASSGAAAAANTIIGDRTSNGINMSFQSYSNTWTNDVVVPNIGFYIENGYSLTATNATNYGDLTFTDFSGVNFTGVNFTGTTLSGSKFTNCNFTNATLVNLTVTAATDFTGATFTGITSSGITGSPILSAEYVMSSGAIVPTLSLPTIGALAAIPTKTLGTDVSFNITAPTTNSSGAFTYTSSNPGVATISTNTVTIVGAGTSTIIATQATDGTYSTASVSTTLIVNSIIPTFGTFTLGPKSGVYVLADVSFSLTAPISDSSGAFSYASDNSAVATITTPSSSQNPTLYSITSPAIPTLSLINFPILGAMPTWEMNIRFTVTGGTYWRALIGDMYNTVNTSRGWGVWVSNSNGLHFGWNGPTWDATPIVVALNTEYVLKITRTPSSLTMLLTTVSTGATQTATNTAMSNTATYVMSVNGPVTIGGWINTSGEKFQGTIAYVTVVNPNSADNNACTSTNLLARYDASIASGYTLSGSNVTQWTDLTGNGYHLIPNGTGPTTTTINSITAFNFNSGLGLYRTSVPLSTTITVFMVAKYSTAIATWGNFMHHGSKDTDWSLERIFSTGSTVQFQTNYDNTYCQIAAANNTNYVWVGRITGNTRQFWMYSDTLAPVYVTSSTPVVNISPGNKTIYVGKSEGNEACNSSIGEIIYYNASLSDADVNANVIYLQNKWLYTKYVPYVYVYTTGQRVNLISNGIANITATQDAYGNYATKSVSSLLAVGTIPTFGTFTLGPKSGAYVLTDVSFSLTAPISDSSGAFSYVSDNSAVATITTITPESSQNPTLYSIANPAIPTLSLTNFPILGAMPTWEMNIRFTVTGGAGTHRALIGDMWNPTAANNAINNRGWGLWVSASSGLYFTWSNPAWDVTQIAVALDTDYILKITRGVGNINISSVAINLSPSPSNTYTLYNSISYVNTIFSMTITGATAGDIWGTDIYTSDTIIAKAAVHAGVLSANETKLVYIEILSPIATYTGSTRNGITSLGFINSSLAYYSYRFITTSVATSLTMLLTTVSTGATQTATNTAMSDTATYVMSVNGPVTIGGWINTSGENFPGTIAYVTVVNPNSAANNACTSTNLLARYDASIASGGYTLSGSNVTQWTDLTGNGYHLIPNGTGPTTTTINSVTAFNFNSGLGLYRTLVPLSTTITVFMVAKYSTAIATWGNFMHHGHRDTDWSLERNSATGSSGLTVQFQSNHDTTQIAAANNTNYVWVGRITGNNRQFWMYSDTVAPVYVTNRTPTVNISGGNKSIYVGKSENSTSEPCNSSIGEILYYNASLSNADVNANVIYLQNKWLYTKYVPYVYTTGQRVNLISNGTANITATQDAYENYATKSVSSLLTLGAIPTFGTFTLGPKSGAYVLTDASFSLTAPTSNSLGAFSFTSDNSAVAIIRYNFKSSNLVARYDASVASGYTLSGSNVTQWNDLTGNGYHLTTNGTGPTLTTINSITAFNFNSGYGLATSTVPKTRMVTVFIVIKYNSNIPAYGTYIQHGNRDFDWSIRNSSGTSNLVINTSGDNASPALAAVNGLNYIFVARLNNSSREIWRYSDSPTAPTNYAIASGNSNLSGGGGYTNNIYVGKSEVDESSQGIIGEILYYNTALSNADVSTNVDYLQNKWFYNINYNANILYVSLISNGTANITATQDGCGNYVTSSVSSALTVGTIPSLGTFTVSSSKIYGDASFNITLRPTSDSSGAITYSSNNTGVATIDASGDWITLLSAGNVTFTATQAATAQYASATKTSNTLTVSPTLSGTFSVPGTKTYGDAAFGATTLPTSNSGGAITYSSNNTGVATIDASGTLITIVGAGVTTFTATQAATAQYAGATKTSNTLTVYVATSTLSASTFSVATTKVYGDAAFSATTLPTSNSSGAITYSSGNTGVATIDASGTLITLVGAGVTTFIATQAAVAGRFSGATNASNTLTVSLGTPTLSASTFSVATTKAYGDAAFSPTTLPTSNSSGAITYSSVTLDTSNNSLSFDGTNDYVATSGNITSLAKANFTIEAWVKTSGTRMGLVTCSDGDNIWESGEKAFYIDASGNPAFVGYGNGYIKSSLAVNDGTWHHIAVVWTYSGSGNAGVGAIYVDGVDRTNVGGTNYSAVYANYGSFQFGLPNYASDESINYFNGSMCELRIWNVARTWAQIVDTMTRRNISASSTGLAAYYPMNVGTANGSNVSLTTLYDSTSNAHNAPLTNFALSGTTSNYVAGPTQTGIAGIDASGTTITIYGVGNVAFVATQAAVAGQFTSATKTSNTLTVSFSATPTLFASTFSVPGTKTYGDAAFSATTLPTSNSSGTITYSSSNTGVATIDASGILITIVGVGDVSFTATQAAVEGQFSRATKTSNTLNVARSYNAYNNFISGTTAQSTSNIWQYFEVDANRSSASLLSNWQLGNAVIPTYGQWDNNRNSGGEMPLVQRVTGSGVISANFGASFTGPALIMHPDDGSSYNVGLGYKNNTPGTITVTVYIALTLLFPANNTDGVNYFIQRGLVNGSRYQLYQGGNLPKSSSTYTFNDTTVELQSGELIYLVINRNGAYFWDHTRVVFEVTRRFTPTIGALATISTKTFKNDVSFNLVDPSSNGSGAFTYMSSNPNVATISSKIVTITGAGTSTITAAQDADASYNNGSVSTTLTVNAALPTFGSFTLGPKSGVYALADVSFSITAPTSDSSGAFSFTSDNSGVATVTTSVSPTGTYVNLVASGTANITATQDASGNYATKSVSSLLTVSSSLTGMPATLAKNVTDAPFVLQATGASSGAITYSTNNSLYATVITNTANNTGVVTLKGVGTVTITATQAATAETGTCVITVASAGTALAGQTVSSGTSFSGVDLSGASFVGSTLSGVSFSSADLTGANFSGAVITGTNFTNANISGATNLPTFSTAQKLQLLLNVNNSGIGAAQINNAITGAALNAALASPVTGTAGEDIAAATFVVRAPTSVDASDNKVISIGTTDVSNNTSIYIPLNENESVKINGVRYTYNGSTIVDASGMVKNYILISGVPFKVYSGSIIAVNVYAALAQFKIGGFDIITVCNDLLVAR